MEVVVLSGDAETYSKLRIYMAIDKLKMKAEQEGNDWRDSVTSPSFEREFKRLCERQQHRDSDSDEEQGGTRTTRAVTIVNLTDNQLGCTLGEVHPDGEFYEADEGQSNAYPGPYDRTIQANKEIWCSNAEVQPRRIFLVNGIVSYTVDDAPSQMVFVVTPSTQPPALESRLPELEKGRFTRPEGADDPLQASEGEDDEALRLKYQDFYRAGGRVIEAPSQEEVAAAVAVGQQPKWSIGVRDGDFLVPVCHQGMNRSQVMRLALTGVVKELYRQMGKPAPEKPSETPWVSRAHGAVSGCDAHSAYRDLDEMNFFGYIFDVGTMFAPGYNAFKDDDPQQGPLQRGFIETFGETKPPRIGEELARELKLNPTSEYTTEREFQKIGEDRERTHHWFNKWVFAPISEIRCRVDQQDPDAPASDEFTIPPPGAERRIFFAFARAVPGIIDRLLEARGAHDSVVVSLQYDDIMNHELRHCAGKTEEELRAKMQEVHLKAYNMYASLLHADTSTRPELEPESKPQLEAEPEPEPASGLEPESKPELAFELEPESKPQLEPEPASELEPESKPQLEPEPASELEPESKPLLEAEPEPASELEPESKPQLEPEPASELEPESKPPLEAEPEPASELEPESKPQLEPEPQAEFTSEPSPAPAFEQHPHPVLEQPLDASEEDGEDGGVDDGGEQDDLNAVLSGFGVPDDIRRHLVTSTYTTARTDSRTSSSRKKAPVENLLSYEQGDEFRLVDPDPITEADNKQYYLVQSWSRGLEGRGLVPVAQCSAFFPEWDNADKVSFALQLAEYGHFPDDKAKEQYRAWAATKGMNRDVAEDVLMQQIECGGEHTGVPIDDAKTELLAQQSELDEWELVDRRRAPGDVEEAEAPSPPTSGEQPGAGACTCNVEYTIDHLVVKEYCGVRQPGGPGTTIDLKLHNGTSTPALVPGHIVAGTTISFGINCETGQPKVVSWSIPGEPIHWEPTLPDDV